MTTSEIIRNFVTTELVLDNSAKKLSDTDKLIDSGIIDSMDILTLLSFLEEQFGIEIESDELLPDNFESIDVMAKMINSKLDKIRGNE
jgi:acyl carrier protein